MASIFIIDAGTTRWGWLATDYGHTLTYASSSDTSAALTTAWGSGHDLIIVRESTADIPWLGGKWAAGVPVLLTKGSAAGNAEPMTALGLGVLNLDNQGSFPSVVALPHAATGVASNTTVTVSAAVTTVTMRETPTGGAHIYGAYTLAYLRGGWAWEVADTLSGTTYAPSVPARTIWLTWAGRDSITATGKAYASVAVDWLTEGAAPPLGPTVSLWDGTTEQAADVTYWDGSTEHTATAEIV